MGPYWVLLAVAIAATLTLPVAVLVFAPTPVSSQETPAARLVASVAADKETYLPVEPDFRLRPPAPPVPLVSGPGPPLAHEAVSGPLRRDEDLRHAGSLRTEPRLHGHDGPNELRTGGLGQRHRDSHEHRSRDRRDAFPHALLRAVPRP